MWLILSDEVRKTGKTHTSFLLHLHYIYHVNHFVFPHVQANASDLFSKNEYAVSTEQMCMMKLCIDRRLECMMFALLFSRSLMYSMMYLFLSTILFHMDMSLFFMFALSPGDDPKMPKSPHERAFLVGRFRMITYYTNHPCRSQVRQG